ncbi:streptogrisin-C-like isoform X2 [Paramacrobiotus metropolitanus]|nr:streptogrisin-C-like isoform X2 [Paramacrobiotus metropolitanus]XP_055337072.1 streptogrisin-C-like isoform X2 [Paramacrobiotus metropolitanus]XP_055337081.1 streptogrisin-C-like isoform X2 [Paramacrobiotus metropolitanus]XP_055337090.1 streptogrisin-C-like isoform X2 [Paramacrobiotus metropolitanus]XP_055337098.1 streptogrisin-C-like isoform X2 [Paramacrobiotus metropolitanus]
MSTGGEFMNPDEQAAAQGGDAGEVPEAPAPAGSSGGSSSEWAVGKTFNVGDLCTFEGQTFKCRQGHRVDAPNWTPPNTLNLWLPVEDNEWKQNTAYNVGDCCTYGGQCYQCLQAHTAYAANWTPPNTPNLWTPK